MHLKMSSAKWRQFCFSLNVLKVSPTDYYTKPDMWLKASAESIIKPAEGNIIPADDQARPSGGMTLKVQYTILTHSRQSECHFADDLYKWICLHENVRISIKISLKLVPEGPIINIPALVQILVWRLRGDRPLSEPMMVRSLTHICITWPQGVSGLVQECNISTANILEILQSYTKLLICIVKYVTHSFSSP